MSFFHKKMPQNVWATIMPFGPVTNILLAQNFQALNNFKMGNQIYFKMAG
jgi:hypothetical protein